MKKYPGLTLLLAGMILLSVILFPSACGPSKEELKEQALGNKTIPEYRGVMGVTIDSCEYIIAHVFNSVSITHKVNCKNHAK